MLLNTRNKFDIYQYSQYLIKFFIFYLIIPPPRISYHCFLYFYSMNFLAHLYLSGESEKMKVGNFIGDYIKGKRYLNYHPEIQQGILLHRYIDSFTDTHQLFLSSSNRLKKGYKRYSSVVVDLIYDHFLANNWDQFHTTPINEYVNNTHEVLIKNYLILPKRVKLFLPFLIQSRRLESYAQMEGLREALNIMSRRTSLPDYTDYAIECLQNEYDDFKNEFHLFMKDMLNYVSKSHQINVATPNDWHLNEER